MKKIFPDTILRLYFSVLQLLKFHSLHRGLQITSITPPPCHYLTAWENPILIWGHNRYKKKKKAN